MSFPIKNNLFIHIILYVITFGLIIGSGSIYRYAYNYNIIMYFILLLMSCVVIYLILIPTNNKNTNSYFTNKFEFDISGLALLSFFIFMPILSDVINQIESYEISYFYIIILILCFLLGKEVRDTILSKYLIIIVILSSISLIYFFIELISDIPSFFPYYGTLRSPTYSHFYYLWSKPAVKYVWIVRNQSIFFEPGAFGFHLIIASLLAFKKKNYLFIFILMFACITTMSTTVYIFLTLIIIYMLLYSKRRILVATLLSLCILLIPISFKLILGNLKIPRIFWGVITEKLSNTGSAFSSLEERLHYSIESFNLFLDNIFIGAGHYASNTELSNIASESSALTGLLAELGIFGIICILMYIKYFKHFKIIAIPIALIWLNGEFMQYSPVSLFILTHMIDDVGKNLFPSTRTSFSNIRPNLLKFNSLN